MSTLNGNGNSRRPMSPGLVKVGEKLDRVRALQAARDAMMGVMPPGVGVPVGVGMTALAGTPDAEGRSESKKSPSTASSQSGVEDPASQEKIDRSIANLSSWRQGVIVAGGSTSKRCLESVRHALKKEGLHLPQSGIDYPGVLAKTAGKTLANDPSGWGWKRVKPDAKGNLPDGSVVFFDNSGKLKDGRIAGHVAIYKDGMLYDNHEPHPYNSWWKSRRIAAFVPDPEADRHRLSGKKKPKR